MRAGRLNRRIVFQLNTPTQNADTREEVASWADLATRFANVRYDKGAERFSSDQFIGRSVATFQVRQESTFTPDPKKHRISFESKYWDIHDVREIGINEGWEIDASARSEA